MPENYEKVAYCLIIIGEDRFFGEYCRTMHDLSFDEKGYLNPYELIPTDLATIETILVEPFSASVSRRKVFDAFVVYVEEFRKAVSSPLEIWVNGSFTTLKLNPNDVDFVIFVDKVVADVHIDVIHKFRQRRYARKSLTDGYFIETVPESDPQYRIYQINRADRHRDFAFERSGRPKGYLQLLI